MNKTWKNIGLIALAAGVLYYPALRMYRMASEKKGGAPEDEMDLEKGSYNTKKKKNNSGGNTNNIIGEA